MEEGDKRRFDPISKIYSASPYNNSHVKTWNGRVLNHDMKAPFDPTFSDLIFNTRIKNSLPTSIESQLNPAR